MQHVLECGKGVSRDIPNLGLVHEHVVEHVGRILLFLIFPVHAAIGIIAHILLGGAGDVEAHLNELVHPTPSFLSLRSGSAEMLLDGRLLVFVRQRELDRHFILAGQVGVGDFRVWDLESGSVLHVEGQFMLAEISLAPVPST